MKQQNADGRGQQGLARDPAGTGRIRRQQERSRGSSRSAGQRDTVSGFKGTELMQVPCSGLGEGLIHTKVTPRSLEAALGCLSVKGSCIQHRAEFTCTGPESALETQPKH